jgi:Tol biopolymer transport system component
MGSDGSGTHRISTVSGYADTFAPVWSPDGQRLMFTGDVRSGAEVSRNTTGTSTAWMINADGSNEHVVDQDAFVGTPSWSPDGQWVAWLHASWDTSLPADFAIADTDAHRLTRFPHEGAHPGRANLDGQSPSLGWSADGKRLIGVLTAVDGTADRLIEIDPATGDSTIISTPGLRAWVQQRLAP